MLYKEVTEDDIVKFLRNKGIREGITMAEVRILAERFEWPEYEMGAARTTERVSRDAILDFPDYPGSVPEWQIADSKLWLEENDGYLHSVCVVSGRTLAIEIYKQVDDWWWVILNLDDIDFFYKSPVYHSDQLQLNYRCDQMPGLVSLLEWACPTDRIKK